MKDVFGWKKVWLLAKFAHLGSVEYITTQKQRYNQP